jgi:predicted Holliday junction resolvase-like endonuclease
MDIYGAKSEPSEKITVLVNPPAFLRIGKLAIDYLTTIITLLVFILLIVLGTFWILQRIKNRKRKLRKEANDTEKALYQAFKVLKKEIEEQVAKLDGKPGLSEREKKVCDDLKEALRISEKFVGKKIKDIKKELQ